MALADVKVLDTGQRLARGGMQHIRLHKWQNQATSSWPCDAVHDPGSQPQAID